MTREYSSMYIQRCSKVDVAKQNKSKISKGKSWQKNNEQERGVLNWVYVCNKMNGEEYNIQTEEQLQIS